MWPNVRNDLESQSENNWVLAVHEQRLTEVFPSRVTEKGLFIAEITKADNQLSQVV